MTQSLGSTEVLATAYFRNCNPKGFSQPKSELTGADHNKTNGNLYRGYM